MLRQERRITHFKLFSAEKTNERPFEFQYVKTDAENLFARGIS
jgi:hypothetical protein